MFIGKIFIFNSPSLFRWYENWFDKSTWMHRYYLNWTELDDDITEFNDELPLTEM